MLKGIMISKYSILINSMAYITEQHFQSRKKFYFVAEEPINKKSVTEHSQHSTKSLYRPQFILSSPKNSDIGIGFLTQKRMQTQSSSNVIQMPNLEQPLIHDHKIRKRSFKKKESIGDLKLTDYLDYLKHKQNQKIVDCAQHLTQTDKVVSLNQLKQSHLKSIKNEQIALLNKLYYCAYGYHSILKGYISLEEIVQKYIDIQNLQTSQFHQTESFVDQFLSDIEIAKRMYSSEKLLQSGLSKITGIDPKIFNLLFRPKRQLPEDISHYQLIPIDKFDVYLRILGLGELPLEYIEHARSLYTSDQVPIIQNVQFRDKEHKIMKNKQILEFGTHWNSSKVECDLDFIRKLHYYQKNLQITLKNKQLDLIANKQFSMKSLSGRRTIIPPMIEEKQSVLYKLEQAELQTGTYPQVSRANRYFFENLDKLERVS